MYKNIRILKLLGIFVACLGLFKLSAMEEMSLDQKFDFYREEFVTQVNRFLDNKHDSEERKKAVINIKAFFDHIKVYEDEGENSLFKKRIIACSTLSSSDKVLQEYDYLFQSLLTGRGGDFAVPYGTTTYSKNIDLKDQLDLITLLLDQNIRDNHNRMSCNSCMVAWPARRHVVYRPVKVCSHVEELEDKKYQQYIIKCIALLKTKCEHENNDDEVNSHVRSYNAEYIRCLARYCKNPDILRAYDKAAGDKLASEIRRDNFIKGGMGLLTAAAIIGIGTYLYKRYQAKKKQLMKEDIIAGQ